MNKPFQLKPVFIEGTKGPLFAMHHEPINRHTNNECIIVIPPFAEEMNRCRYMQTLLAQELTKHGYGLLSVDPYGTGDSTGEFKEAGWQDWVSDSITSAEYSSQLGYKSISILAIRLGSLLAAAAMPSIEGLKRIILWQPISNGKAALNQFLRLKIAAAMARDEETETTTQLEDKINQGQSIQVAGYDVSPALFQGIHSAHLNNHLSFATTPISWLTISPNEERKTPRADLQIIEKWRSNGAEIEHKTVIGPAFWQAHERTLAPNLIPATIKAITSTEGQMA